MRTIVNKAIDELVQDGYSAEELQTAFLMKALDVAIKNNYVVDITVERFSEEKDKIGPFAGIPFSVCDWID